MSDRIVYSVLGSESRTFPNRGCTTRACEGGSNPRSGKVLSESSTDHIYRYFEIFGQLPYIQLVYLINFANQLKKRYKKVKIQKCPKLSQNCFQNLLRCKIPKQNPYLRRSLRQGKNFKEKFVSLTVSEIFRFFMVLESKILTFHRYRKLKYHYSFIKGDQYQKVAK